MHNDHELMSRLKALAPGGIDHIVEVSIRSERRGRRRFDENGGIDRDLRRRM